MALEPITRQEKIIAGQDLTPITRMEKFLKQYGGGSGGVTSWNDLTDKPFGEVTTVKEVLAECQPTYHAAGDTDGTLSSFGIRNPFEIVPGEKYIVSWNGTEYLSTAVGIEGVAFLGNLSTVGMEDTGEPFVMQMTDGTPEAPGHPVEYALVVPLDGSTTLTISIRQEVPEVKKISGKYVDGMGYSDKSWVTVVPEQTVTVAEDGSATTNTVNSIAVGNSARIVWNDTAFECVAFELDGMPVVGNLSIAGAGDDTGEPFLIGFQGNTAMIFAASTGDNVIAVTAECEIIHPIDKKYLYRKVITVTTDTSGYYNPPPVSMTFDDAFAAYESGFELVLVVEVFKGDLTTKVSDAIYTLVRVDYDRDKALIFQHFSGSTSRVATYSEENGLSFMDYNFAT